MTIDARLLHELRSTAVHLPYGDLAAQFGVTRAQVEAALARLREAGFDIEIKPGLGCRLLGSPDRLIADDLLSRIGQCGLAREILVFEETSSTNDAAARFGREGHPGGLVVFAERQTAGRGRFGRNWASAAHAGLWFSILLRPPWPPAHLVRLTTWAGVGVASAVERTIGRPVQVKWPNDVLVDQKKVAGVLTECATDASGCMFVVVGIGLNVNQEGFPAELADRAGSLRQFAGRALDRPALAAAVLLELNARLADASEAFDRIISSATRRSSILGTWVRLHAADTIFEGTAEGLDADGNLLLRMRDGDLRTMTAGEITSRVPVPLP
jgi:BirA family biotin operon repressor/biotin-[acetyl-CoA-carboxylase] ligase